jgi:hypothetical protein
MPKVTNAPTKPAKTTTQARVESSPVLDSSGIRIDSDKMAVEKSSETVVEECYSMIVESVKAVAFRIIWRSFSELFGVISGDSL